MFQIGKTIVSEDILEKEFVCNLSACKGACCVDGDAGAPLSEAETKILESIYPKVKLVFFIIQFKPPFGGFFCVIDVTCRVNRI